MARDKHPEESVDPRKRADLEESTGTCEARFLLDLSLDLQGAYKSLKPMRMGVWYTRDRTDLVWQ